MTIEMRDVVCGEDAGQEITNDATNAMDAENVKAGLDRLAERTAAV